MKLSTIMTIKSLSALVLGTILLATPNFILNLVGIDGSLSSAIFGRTFGAVVLGICCLTWFARNSEDSVARRAIVLTLVVYDAAEFILLMVLQLTGVTNLFGWIYIAMYLFFAASFGYFVIPRKEPSISLHP